MLREKRQTAVPVPYQIPLICYPRKRKKKPKKVAQPQCAYQPIPFPLKFIYASGMYALYGGVTLKEYNGNLETENSLLSQFLRTKEIQVTTHQDLKIINLAIDDIPDYQLCPWQYMVERLKESENPNFLRWGDTIKEYCLKFEDKLRRWSSKEGLLSQYSEEYLENMNRESEQKMAEFFKTYPCLNFKSTTCGSSMKLTDIVMNEEYLEALGYSIDTFTVTALNGEIPQFPGNNTQAVKMWMESYHTLEKGACHTPELESEMTLRKGYVRKINYKVHYLMTYKDGVFGMNSLVALTNKTLPSVKNFAVPSSGIYLNKAYRDNAVAKEREASIFLGKYYNAIANLEYTNMDKVCHVKHIDEFAKQE